MSESRFRVVAEPDRAAFRDSYSANNPQLVWTRLVADLETPVSAFLKIAAGKPYSFLFESVEGGAVRGRYSMIGLDPDQIWRVQGRQSEICRDVQSGAFSPCAGPVLDSLRRFIGDARIDVPAQLPPMAAGAFGYLGYEMVGLVEDLPEPKVHPLGLSDAILVRPQIMAIFDNVRDEICVITPARPDTDLDADSAYDLALQRIDQVVTALERPLDHRLPALTLASDEGQSRSNIDDSEYFDMVARVKAYISAGDIFQVVVSQRFEAPFSLPPFALYRALRRTNPSPFLYFLDFGDFSIVGSSPEILVRVRNGEVTLRPIAGTRPRGETPERDKALAAELLADPKERAEHLMLLDLGRNDVGRVARIGTVRVTESFILEYYSQVMHIVSNVVGELDPAYDAIDALFAGFPAGTVSGAPKVRAMEIIHELERDGRGVYAGCVGYFSAAGDMDSCIALRTAIVKDGRMYVQAGGGVVADSMPQEERQESVNKAEALFRAAREAMRFATETDRGAV